MGDGYFVPSERDVIALEILHGSWFESLLFSRQSYQQRNGIFIAYHA